MARARDEVISKPVARAAALLGSTNATTNATLAHTLGVSEATALRRCAGRVDAKRDRTGRDS